MGWVIMSERELNRVNDASSMSSIRKMIRPHQDFFSGTTYLAFGGDPLGT